MTAQPSPSPTPQRTDQATVRKNMRFSPIWLIPILVGLVVLYVGYDTIKKRGKTITLTFESADGLVPGETPVRHKNVRLGTVEDVTLTDDLKSVEVKVKVDQHEAELLTDRARFWVVRPRLNGNLSSLTAGLETLVSGAYIAVDPGLPGGKEQRAFKGLEEPPGIRSDVPGSVFNVETKKLGALGAGSPVYFHEMVVGEVLNTELGDGRAPIQLRLFIRAPFDKFVVERTQFWSISGLSLNMGPEGLHVELQSLQAVVSGGIAFEEPEHVRGTTGPVSNDTIFSLYDDKASADAAAFRIHIPCVTYFNTSVQGLGVNANVQMLGATVGVVREVRLVSDPTKPNSWLARIAFDVQPQRISDDQRAAMSVESLKERPPRVFLDSTSILTGQKVITLDFGTTHPPKPGEVKMEGDALVLPGETGGIENVTVAMGHIAGKLEQIPFDEIGKNLDVTMRSISQITSSPELNSAIRDLSATMADAKKMMKQADEGLSPALARVPKMADQLESALTNANNAFGSTGYGSDSDFQRNMTRMMTQVSEAVRSIRLLADFLDRHPDSLLRGRKNGPSEK